MRQYLTKRNIIVAAVLLLVTVGAIIGLTSLVNYLNLRDVNFRLSATVDSVSIYTNYNSETVQPNLVKTINSDGLVKLADGSYQLLPEGSNIDTSPINLTVDQNTTRVVVNPNYSENYLNSMFDSGQKITSYAVDSTGVQAVEIPTDSALINATISSKYAGIIDYYDISDGRLLSDGTWYIASLTRKDVDPAAIGFDVYKIILHFDVVWEVVAPPSLVFRYANYPDIPEYVVYEANQL